MKTLLAVAVALWLIAGWSYKAVDHAGDNFAAAIWPLLFGGCAIVFTAALFVLALIRAL